MKQITLKFLFVALIGGCMSVNAQDDASDFVATSVDVITPISIVGVNSLQFGDVVGTAGGGDVTVATDGTRSSTATDLVIDGTPGTISAASFTVSGQDTYGYDITLPADFTVANEDTEPATMDVKSFTSDPDQTGTLTGGTETVSVGATLTLGENQAPGTYTNANDLSITVQYN